MCLGDLLVADGFGCEKEMAMWGWPFLFRYDTHRWCNKNIQLDGVTQDIQLLTL